jgi:hypothetical protein
VMDPEAVERVGFLISFGLGMAVDIEPDHGNWVTAFTKGRWDRIVNRV